MVTLGSYMPGQLTCPSWLPSWGRERDTDRAAQKAMSPRAKGSMSVCQDEREVGVAGRNEKAGDTTMQSHCVISFM